MDHVALNKDIQNKINKDSNYITLSDYVRTLNNGSFNKSGYTSLSRSCKKGIIWNSSRIVGSPGWVVRRITTYDVNDTATIETVKNLTGLSYFQITSAVKNNKVPILGWGNKRYFIKKESLPYFKTCIKGSANYSVKRNFKTIDKTIDRLSIIQYLKFWLPNDLKNILYVQKNVGISRSVIFRAVENGLLKVEKSKDVVTVSKKSFIGWLNSRLVDKLDIDDFS